MAEFIFDRYQLANRECTRHEPKAFYRQDLHDQVLMI